MQCQCRSLACLRGLHLYFRLRSREGVTRLRDRPRQYWPRGFSQASGTPRSRSAASRCLSVVGFRFSVFSCRFWFSVVGFQFSVVGFQLSVFSFLLSGVSFQKAIAYVVNAMAGLGIAIMMRRPWSRRPGAVKAIISARASGAGSNAITVVPAASRREISSGARHDGPATRMSPGFGGAGCRLFHVFGRAPAPDRKSVV